MNISINGNGGNVCKLSQTDRNRIASVINICVAIDRHTDNDTLKMFAKASEHDLDLMMKEFDKLPAAAAPAKA